MTTPPQIQRGIPKPPVDRKPKNPKRVFPVMQDMQPGDMFFLPNRNSRQVSAYVSRITKDLPGKFEVMQTWGRKPLPTEDRSLEWVITTECAPGATRGVGVWRTK